MQTLSNDLAAARPFIGRIAHEPNLTGFFSIFEDALKATDKKAADKAQVVPVGLASLADKIANVLHKATNGENALLSWQSLIAEKKRRSDKEFIIVSPRLDYSKIRPAEGAIEAIRKAC